MSFDFIIHLREELKKKFRAYYKDNNEDMKYCGLSHLDTIPTAALKMQSSPGMHALFTTLLETDEIFNAFDIPQLVAKGEHQHYRGLNMLGSGYVCLLTLTSQMLTNGMGLPEGTLFIYDSKRGASLLAPNPSKSKCEMQRNKSTGWLGLRFTFWKEDLLDSQTRNTLYLTGGFGLHIPLDKPRSILPERVALLNNNLVRHTCIAKESWKKTVDQIVEEAQTTLEKGEPFPSQLIWEPVKKRIQFQHHRTGSRCPHPHCENSDKVYVNMKLHMSSRHSQDLSHRGSMVQKRKKTSSIISFDRQMDNLNNAREEYVPNVPTKRGSNQNETNKKKHCNINQVKKQVNFTFPSESVEANINRDSVPKVCQNRRKRLSLNKSPQLLPPAQDREGEYEVGDVLNEMIRFSPPISPLPQSPTYEPLDDNLSTSSDEELENDELHTTIDFENLYAATIQYRKELGEADELDNNRMTGDEVCNGKSNSTSTCCKIDCQLNPIDQPSQTKCSHIPIDENLMADINTFPSLATSDKEEDGSDFIFDDTLHQSFDNEDVLIDLDRLDTALKQINVDNIKEPLKNEKVMECGQDDILMPLRNVLDNHSYSEDRDFDAERNRTHVQPKEFGKCPTQMDLTYDCSIRLVTTDTNNSIAIYKRQYLSWNKNEYLKDYIFCDISVFKDVTPDVMMADDVYRKLRCYMKTKTENSVYEIRGARTVIDAVKIFYLGMEKIKCKTERKVKKTEKWCFMLADEQEALNRITEGKVYDVIRIPAVSVTPQQHHLVYPDWRYPYYEAPNYQYLPFRQEPKLSRGIRSAITIPVEKQEKIKQLSDFLYNEFFKRFNHHAEVSRCQRLATLLLDELSRLSLPKFNVSMPQTLDDLIKEHQQAKQLMVKYAVDILLDPKSQESMMDKLKKVALKQMLIMKNIEQSQSKIDEMYKPIDELTRSDILLLGIVVKEESFYFGLHFCDWERHKQ